MYLSHFNSRLKLFFRYSEEEIVKKVEKFRKQLFEKDSQKDDEDVTIEYDQFGKPM